MSFRSFDRCLGNAHLFEQFLVFFRTGFDRELGTEDIGDLGTVPISTT